MNVCEELEKLLRESYADTLKEKLLYCLGYLESDDENEDLYNLFSYMLYSEHDTPRSTFDLVPSIDCSLVSNPLVPSLDKYNLSGNRTKCKKCVHYHDDVLLYCTGCKRFNNNSALYLDKFEKSKDDK